MSPENFSLFKLYKFICTLKDLSRKDQRLIRLPCRAKNVIGFKKIKCRLCIFRNYLKVINEKFMLGILS